MPHNVDIDGIHEMLFVLQNLAYASRPFCEAHLIHRYAESERDFDWNYYRGWLKFLVSERLINCATKIRILQDMLREHSTELDLSQTDRDATAGLNVGHFHTGTETLNVREACNKIIHALDVTLEWSEVGDSNPFEYWTGNVWLVGARGKQEWKLELNVNALCTALSRFVDALESSVDWAHLYKYDE